jgi:hypothetical protein
VFVISFLPIAVAFGQQTTGEIQGTVTDPQGAVVPNAEIALRGIDVVSLEQFKPDSQGFIVQDNSARFVQSTASAQISSDNKRENVQLFLKSLQQLTLFSYW